MSVRRMVVIAVALLVMVVTAALGRWQLQRGAQRDQRQARVVERAKLPVLDASALRDARDVDAREALLERRIELRGTWDAAHQIFLDNRSMGHESGFYVLTPLRLADRGDAILVLRGWAPRDQADRERLPDVATPDGSVDVQGRLISHVPTTYALGQDSAGRIRQNASIDGLRGETGLALLPLVVEQTGARAEGLLRDWPQPGSGSERNYGYAFQWFGMSALAGILLAWFQILRPLRQRRREMHG